MPTVPYLETQEGNMRIIDRDELEAYRMEVSKVGRVSKHAFKTVEPLLTMAEDDQHRLWPADDLDPKRIALEISLAVGTEAKEVRFLSASRIARRPDLIPTGAYYALISRIYAKSLAGLLPAPSDKKLTRRQEQWLEDILRSDIWLELPQKIWRRHYSAIVDENNFAGLAIATVLNVYAALFRFLTFATLGDGRMAGRLEPLIKRLPKAVPIGEKADEPGVWLVLTA